MTNKKQHRTSLKDLARELGVSIATVSRALRNSPEIGKEMQQRVKDLAKKLNYRPNPFAQSLRREAPKIIGVVVPNLVTHYYAAVLDGIEDEARRAGYSVISANSHESYEDEEHAVDNFISMHVEGIVACLAQNTTDYHHFEEIAEMGIPLVFFGRTCLTDRFSSVTANGDEAAQQATQHLIDTGSRRIAFIGGPNHLDMVRRYAIESGLPIVRANYSGISAFIGSDGNIISMMPVGDTGSLDGFVWGAHNTPYRMIGRDMWMIFILMFSISVLISIPLFQKKD